MDAIHFAKIVLGLHRQSALGVWKIVWYYSLTVDAIVRMATFWRMKDAPLVTNCVVNVLRKALNALLVRAPSTQFSLTVQLAYANLDIIWHLAVYALVLSSIECNGLCATCSGSTKHDCLEC